ncbi:MAG: hypothetical protein QM237_02915 [Bacteroidota bacterium]|jgi:uncharacterized membrane protein HdeD (DUF308 family)|nr:hypothetical protein [Bacteroidota bacterium]HHU95912.1 hypothetical protein [Petrimonas sp.]
MKEFKRGIDPKKQFKLIWGVTMGILYIAFAYLLVFTPIFESRLLPKGIRVMLGVIFTLYGVMRGYRSWKER